MKEQDAEREARGIEALERELARTEAALAALQTEHEELEAARAQLIRSLHRLEARLVPGARAWSLVQAAVSAPSCTAHAELAERATRALACGVCYARACEPVPPARQEEVAEERAAADDARAAHSRARLAAYGLGLTTALSVITVGVVTARCLRQRA